jgi:hypothetical protein
LARSLGVEAEIRWRPFFPWVAMVESISGLIDRFLLWISDDHDARRRRRINNRSLRSYAASPANMWRQFRLLADLFRGISSLVCRTAYLRRGPSQGNRIVSTCLATFLWSRNVNDTSKLHHGLWVWSPGPLVP